MPTPEDKLATERIEKPWGFEQIKVHAERYVVKTLHILPGEGTSIQFHEKKDESVSLVSGDVRLLVYRSKDDTPSQSSLKVGKWLRIHPGTIHRMESDKGGEVLEVSTPELDDVVRLIDPYNR